jgi:riboflavin biosynthesis pyrimidine reductase
MDGIVALGGEVESGGIISVHSEADRFVMGLLRACADAVVVGAGTFRKTPNHLWTAEHIYPSAAGAFGELRAKLAMTRRPTFVLVTASGAVDAEHPALERDALVVTRCSNRSPRIGDPSSPAAQHSDCARASYSRVAKSDVDLDRGTITVARSHDRDTTKGGAAGGAAAARAAAAVD